MAETYLTAFALIFFAIHYAEMKGKSCELTSQNL